MPASVAATVLAPDPVRVDAVRLDDRLLIPVDDLAAATGWELKPEGLCQGDVCVPVRDRSHLVHEIDEDHLVDLAALGVALRVRHVVDAEAAVAAFGRPNAGPTGLDAPDFTLPDLDGNPVSLSDHDDRKKLLLAFASW